MTPAAPQQTRDAIRAAIAAGRAADAERMARALTISAPSPEVFELLSAALRAQGKADKAVAAAEDGLRLDLGSIRLTHARALGLADLGRNEEALRVFDSLAKRGVEQPPIWLSRGIALLGLARDADAEAMFADGVRRWPQDQGLQQGLASVRWMRGQGPANW